MNPLLVQADRNAAVRAAARGWRRAGVIDDGALAAVDVAYPDDRHGVGPVFRVLLFLFTLLSIAGAYGFFLALGSLASEILFGSLLVVFGVASVAATELQVTVLRRRGGGIEAATSLAGIAYLVGFVLWSCFESQAKEETCAAVTLFGAALLLAGAAWRWGYPLYAGGAAAAFLGALVAFPGGRLAWIVLPLAAAPLLLRLAEFPRFPPSHRACGTAALGVALAALYAAVNLASHDLGWLEPWNVLRIDAEWPRPLFAAATALVPLAYLALGLRSRRYVFLLLGLATGLASLATLRFYVHLAPPWALLTLAGGALIAGVLGLRRYLDAGAGRERRGYTAEPLFEDAVRRRALEAGAAVLSLSPEARPLSEEPRFSGGGGSFGGGGASGDF